MILGASMCGLDPVRGVARETPRRVSPPLFTTPSEARARLSVGFARERASGRGSGTHVVVRGMCGGVAEPPARARPAHQRAWSTLREHFIAVDAEATSRRGRREGWRQRLDEGARGHRRDPQAHAGGHHLPGTPPSTPTHAPTPTPRPRREEPRHVIKIPPPHASPHSPAPSIPLHP